MHTLSHQKMDSYDSRRDKPVEKHRFGHNFVIRHGSQVFIISHYKWAMTSAGSKFEQGSYQSWIIYQHKKILHFLMHLVVNKLFRLTTIW